MELGAGDTAIVDLGGVRKEISVALLDDVKVGDYVILHVGYALSKLDPEEAAATLALFAQMNASMAEQSGSADGADAEAASGKIGDDRA
jgi:hydrogenase expression/formation protein HypC